MDRFLALVPKNLIATVAIVGGILFIVFSEPPHTVCDSQKEILDQAQQKLLYKDPKSKTQVTTKYQMLRDHCKATNDPGGCYEFFQEIKSLLRDLATVPAQCGSEIGGIREVKAALWESVEILVRIAWGEKPPEAYNAKFGWLEIPDVSLFCGLKRQIIAFYGEPAFDKFREKMMKELPGAVNLQRSQVWDMTLFSENCQRYP